MPNEMRTPSQTMPASRQQSSSTTRTWSALGSCPVKLEWTTLTFLLHILEVQCHCLRTWKVLQHTEFSKQPPVNTYTTTLSLQLLWFELFKLFSSNLILNKNCSLFNNSTQKCNLCELPEMNFSRNGEE